MPKRRLIPGGREEKIFSILIKEAKLTVDKNATEETQHYRSQDDVAIKDV